MAVKYVGMARFLSFVAAASVAMAGCGGDGNGGGDGGGGGGGSGAAGGGDGGGGSPPAAATRTCSMGEVSGESPAEPEIVTAVKGQNGTFTDHCNGSGDLVEYVCEVDEACGSDFCEPILTGKVVEEAVDCEGTCQAGACDLGCPDKGAELSVVSVDAAGITTLNDAASGTDYTCGSVLDVDPNDGWECAGAQAAGAKGTADVVSAGGFCTQGKGGLGVKFSAGSCFYSDCARSK